MLLIVRAIWSSLHRCAIKFAAPGFLADTCIFQSPSIMWMKLNSRFPSQVLLSRNYLFLSIKGAESELQFCLTTSNSTPAMGVLSNSFHAYICLGPNPRRLGKRRGSHAWPHKCQLCWRLPREHACYGLGLRNLRHPYHTLRECKQWCPRLLGRLCRVPQFARSHCACPSARAFLLKTRRWHHYCPLCPSHRCTY